MKLTGYPRDWDEKEGLLPIEVQDLIVCGTPDELRQLSEYFKDCADCLEKDGADIPSLELGDLRPDPQTGVSFLVQK